MLQRQRKLNFLVEMQLQATTECDIHKLHPRLPVVSLIFCLFSKYFPSKFAFLYFAAYSVHISFARGAKSLFAP